MNKEPLVSTYIITYNSAEFILETLESFKAQTYKNIELIVSDDASTDNTVELCREWLSQNKERFINSTLLTVEKNTGVSANCNRAAQRCKGAFLKGLAGDDKLLPNCIADNVDYMLQHPETDVVFSDELLFGANEDGRRVSSRKVYFEYLSEHEFKTHLLVRNFLPAPATFMKREFYERMGGCDESIPMMDDKPFYIRALFAGCNMAYMPKPTVCYRVNEKSLSNSDEKSEGAIKLEKSRELASELILEYSRKVSPLLWAYQKAEFDYRFHPNGKTKAKRLLRFVNPYFYYVNFIFQKIRVISHLKHD